nr:serine carboxypeptidase II-3-like [Tanacetum cinerariifolium]
MADGGSIAIGLYEHFWKHAIISDEIYEGIVTYCNFSEGAKTKSVCDHYITEAKVSLNNIELNDIYQPLCSPSANSTPSISSFDPCSRTYIRGYLNTPAVQQSLHAKPCDWEHCKWCLLDDWKDMPFTVLPVIKDLMTSGIRVWMYSGDTDAKCSVTSTKLSINKLKPLVKTPWYPWMYEGEVGGYVVEYQNLTFVTIRGAGHTVPSYQPGRAFEVYASFLEGTLP